MSGSILCGEGPGALVVRNATTYSTMPRTVFHSKELSGPNVSGAEAEKSGIGSS